MKREIKHTGFTLVEILIVIVIMGISAAVMLPLLGSNTGFQLQASKRDLNSIIQYTQNLAITKQQKYQIVFDTIGNKFAVSDEAGNLIDDPGKTAPSGTTEPEKYKLRRLYGQNDNYSRVVLTSALFDGTAILWFDSLGIPNSGDIEDNTPLASGTITLTAGNNTMTLKVEPVSGKITIE